MIKFSKCNRKSISVDTSKYCIFANNDDTLEVTQYGNKEGYDIEFIRTNNESRSDLNIKLTNGEFKALTECIKRL